MVEALIKGGAFDCLGKYRSQLLAVHDAMIERALQKGKDNLEGQLDMFSMPGQVSTEAPAVKYPDIPELSVREKLMLEKEAAGMYFSGSLLDEYSKHTGMLQFSPISDMVGEDADPVDRAAMKTVGIITSVTVKGTKNGKRMAFFTLEDRTAEVECIVFPNLFEELAPLLVRDNAVLVRGTVSLREEEDAKLLVQGVVDCCFVLPDGGIKLVDYKTDRLGKTPAEGGILLWERYANQLFYYKQALEKIMGKPVLEVSLYSFYHGEEFPMPKNLYKELC